MCSVSSGQRAWQRSPQHAGVLYFCIFAVLLLAMLCCCQPGTLGLDFDVYFRKQPHLQKSKASFWEWHVEVLLSCFQDFSLANRPSEPGCGRSHIAVVGSFFQLVWNAALLCLESSTDVRTLPGWLSRPRGKILRSVQVQSRKAGYWDRALLPLRRWGCQPYRCL